MGKSMRMASRLQMNEGGGVTKFVTTRMAGGTHSQEEVERPRKG